MLRLAAIRQRNAFRRSLTAATPWLSASSRSQATFQHRSTNGDGSWLSTESATSATSSSSVAHTWLSRSYATAAAKHSGYAGDRGEGPSSLAPRRGRPSRPSPPKRDGDRRERGGSTREATSSRREQSRSLGKGRESPDDRPQRGREEARLRREESRKVAEAESSRLRDVETKRLTGADTTSDRRAAAGAGRSTPVRLRKAAEESEAPIPTSNPVADKFERLGLSSGLSRQLTSTFPHITTPTRAQKALLPAILASNDVIIRDHTGTGKSFGLLLAMLAKPRITFKSSSGSRGGIASMILVPTRELALQYLAWSRILMPANVVSSLDSVVQVVTRGDHTQTPQAQMERLKSKPPHILIATPSRALEIMKEQGGIRTLGLQTIKALVLDEADAIFDLPSKFPSKKEVWQNISHPPKGLEFVNEIMKIRSTFSGGELIPSAGLEPARGKTFDEVLPPEGIRRTQHKSRERYQQQSWLAPPKRLGEFDEPLQFIACSASANAVMRNFLGAKTGWLRLGVARGGSDDPVSFGHRRNATPSRRVTGKWLDLTGLSGTTYVSEGQAEATMAQIEQARMMPPELKHYCVVVDESVSTHAGTESSSHLPIRNLSSKRLGRSLRTDDDLEESASRKHVDQLTVPSYTAEAAKETGGSSSRGIVDDNLLEALAYVIATQNIRNALIFIPPQASLRGIQNRLAELDVKTCSLEELVATSAMEGTESDSKIGIIQSSIGRGIDVADLSHVFLLGRDAVGDAVQYTHLAGRASRLCRNVSAQTSEHVRNPGKVISIVKGLSTSAVLENDELVIARRKRLERAAKRAQRTLLSNQIANERLSDEEKLKLAKLADEGDLMGEEEDAVEEAESEDKKRLLISSEERSVSSLLHRLGVQPGRIRLGVMDSEV